MDYLKKIEESVKFAWKYKTLWIFGLILSIFTGGGGGNFNFSSNYDSSETDEASRALEDFFDKPEAWILVFGVLAFVLIISLIGWYLASISKAALINAVDIDNKGEIPTFKKGWNFGKTKALRIMWMDIIGFLISLVLLIPFVGVIILGIILPPFMILLCLLAPFLFVFVILWAMVYTAAQRYLVLRNLSAWESIKAGWELSKKTISELVTGWFVGCLAGCAWAIILIPLTMILGFALLAVVVMGIIANPLVGILMAIFGLVVLVLFLAVVDSPYRVFSHTYWTKIVMELMEKYDAKK